MGKYKYKDYNQSQPPAGHVSEAQLRLTHAEIADRGGELTELDLHGETAQGASIAVYDYVLEKLGKNFEAVVYQNAGHAFFNDTNVRMYNAAAAGAAWEKTPAFLKENLLS